MNDISTLLRQYRIIPIVVGLEDPRTILPICDILLEEDFPLLEITLRTDASFEALRLAASERPDILLGAGTILTKKQAEQSIEAGAAFLVSPGFDRDLVEYSLTTNTPIIPGTCTPTEVQTAMNLGLEIVKFFPATTMGGTGTLSFMAGPYPSINFVVTGGITLANLESYLSLSNVIACGGTWMFVWDNHKQPDLTEISFLLQRTRMLVQHTMESLPGVIK